VIDGILLAAGNSRRFGADKLLQALSDGTPVAVSAARRLVAGVGSAVAVIRATGELSQRLADEGCRVVVCNEAASGMGRTLACGVQAAREASGWVIALADMPLIRVETMRPSLV
jgi:molybdenum cofactor cytidylyltransferase